jgi:hypothetical protein
MTSDRDPEPIEEAVAEGDVSRAFTPGQLVLVALVGIIVLRILRRWWESARAERLTR